MQLRSIVLMTALVSLGSVPFANAQGFIAPFAGGTAIGDADRTGFTYGASVGALAGGVLGVELDVSQTPSFLGDSPLLNLVVRQSTLTTVMGNVIVGVPIGGVQPYVSGGAGLIRWRLQGPAEFLTLQGNDLAADLGGGLAIYPGGPVGIRADFRYFRPFQDSKKDLIGLLLLDLDLADLGIRNFWRGTVGVTVRF